MEEQNEQSKDKFIQIQDVISGELKLYEKIASNLRVDVALCARLGYSISQKHKEVLLEAVEDMIKVLRGIKNI